MSNDVDRKQVFQTTRVRTALKNDISWIQKSKEEKKEEDNERMDEAVETIPVLVKQNSYVLFTAKKFEPQASTEKNVQNGEAQLENSSASTTAENKEEHVVTADDQSNVEHNERAAEVSADVHVEECIQNGEVQPVSSTKENPEAESPVEPAEQPVADTTAENKAEYAETTADHSNVEQNEAKISADAHVEDNVAETSAAAGTEEGKDSAAEQAIGETVEAVAEANVETLPVTPAVTDAAGEEAALQDSVEPVSDLTASDAEVVQAEAVQDKLAYSAIELTDALDVEPPAAEAAPETLEDPKQSDIEDLKLNQQRDDANTSEIFQKPVNEIQSTQTLKTRDGKAVCSFCDKIIDGNVKITFSEPLVSCHPDCLKCGVCAKALGDLLVPMFLHNQVIQCDGCFAKALRT